MTEQILLNLCSSGSKTPLYTEKNPLLSRTHSAPNKVMLDSGSCLLQVHPKQKIILAFFREKSGCQKQSGIQLMITFNSSNSVCPGQGSPFPSLLSDPDPSFCLKIPLETRLFPTTGHWLQQLPPHPFSPLFFRYVSTTAVTFRADVWSIPAGLFSLTLSVRLGNKTRN